MSGPSSAAIDDRPSRILSGEVRIDASNRELTVVAPVKFQPPKVERFLSGEIFEVRCQNEGVLVLADSSHLLVVTETDSSRVAVTREANPDRGIESIFVAGSGEILGLTFDGVALDAVSSNETRESLAAGVDRTNVERVTPRFRRAHASGAIRPDATCCAGRTVVHGRTGSSRPPC